jgi:hypothetical protein
MQTGIREKPVEDRFNIKKPAMNVMVGLLKHKKGVACGPRILTFRSAS